MKNSNPYHEHAQEYDAWFEKHPEWFRSEIKALKKVIAPSGHSIEIGIGTGRFANALGIKEGVEPSEKMGEIARARGLKVINGVAENLPYANLSLDLVLMVTVDCFLNDLIRPLREIYRVLKPGGSLVIGMIDKSSPLGKIYESSKKDNIFYCDAKFHDVEEITSVLKELNFHTFQYWQTLTNVSIEVFEEAKPGYGEGGFVVMRAIK